MPAKKFFPLLALLSFLAVVLILWGSLSQPGISDLAGGFKEAALYRNENNTGPVMRIYAVSVKDTLWQQMQQYGNFMPHTKYGTTKVYFFLEGAPVPDIVRAGATHFEERYQPYCLASYEKGSMGGVQFIRYPFR